MKKKTLISAFFVLASLASQAQNGTTYYVRQGGSGTGTSWANAGDLEATVATAVTGDEIWVKTGIYNPVGTLTLPQDVKMYGGFAGTETDPSERDISKNLTTIDGSNHIGGSVIHLSNLCVIDGFIIQGGNRNSQNQNGGGVYAEDHTVIENCIIRKNFAYNGGGVYGRGHVKIINSEVSDNKAASLGFNTYGHCLTISIEPSAPVVSGPGGITCPPCQNNPDCDTTGDYCKPVITVQPNDTIRIQEFGEPFPTLSVSANSTSPLSYQWYSMTNMNGTATPITGETQAFFTPSSSQYGTMFYYCVVSNDCGEVKSLVGGIHITAACIPPRFSTHPSAQSEEVVKGIGTFPLLSVSAIGTTEQYQWFSNTVNSNKGGTLESTGSASYQPSNTIPSGTTMYYYCVVTNACGSDTSDVSGAHTVAATCVPPSVVGPHGTAETRPLNGNAFTPLSVSVSGTLPLTYQWYSAPAENGMGRKPVGTNSPSYTPSNAATGDLWYFCIVSNSCSNGVYSFISGKHTVTGGSVGTPASARGCNSTSTLPRGSVTYGNTSNANPAVGAVNIGGRMWSRPVFVSSCDKTGFNGGSNGNFNSDCRRSHATDRNYPDYGDLFSWCAVVRYASSLCPAPWRVPTNSDFCDLDNALGGPSPCTAVGTAHSTSGVAAKYVSQWSGARGGFYNTGSSGIVYQGSYGYYWASSEYNDDNGFRMYFNSSEAGPQAWNIKSLGYAVRCVK